MTIGGKAWLVALWAVVLGLVHAAPALAIKIRIKGSAQLEGAAIAEGDAVVVRGQLTDDVGVPIEGSAVLLSAVAIEGARRAVQLPAPTSCEGVHALIARKSAEEWSVETDPRGAFCVVVRGPLEKVKIELRFPGTSSWEGTKVALDVDRDGAKLARTVLRFEPAPDVIDLDKPTALVTASLRIDRSEASRLPSGGPVRREGLALVLEDQRGTKLADAITGGDGRARFEVKTADLEGPGPGELVVRFDATGTLAKASTSQPIVRRAQASLSLAHPVEPAGEDGAVVDVDVTTLRGPVDAGVVEAVRGTDSVGAGRVEAGRARVIVAVTDDRRGRVPVLLRYVPAAPWYRAGAMLEIAVSVAGPGIWRQLLLAVLVTGVAAWIVAGWRRAPKIAPPPDLEGQTAPPSGRPGVQVLGQATGSGWRGHVTDAHEGTPIVGAVLKIVQPGFDREEIVAQTATDERGAFVLEGTQRSGARLLVESDEHSAYEQALPPPSTLHVALVTRRRALVDRLVRWARRQGPPYDGPPEPTPGHVRRVAGRGDATDVEAWARRVEHVAFGPDVVDAQVEQDVRGTEPRGGVKA